MSESQALDVDEKPVAVEHPRRTQGNKPPQRSTPFTAVAGSRAPGKTRTAMAADLRTQDDLVTASVGNMHFKPVTVAGVSLKLEPLQPSIGTVVHGIDLAKDLADPEMVSFLRSLWLERRVIMFRDQNHLTPRQQVEFASHFGEVGVRYGERGHEPNTPNRTHSMAIDGIPEMLVLISDEEAPAAASGWHADATWQKRPPMASVLLCREAPPIGGDTCFCDCYSMWQGLSEKTRKRVEHLTAIHEGNVNHRMDGKTPVSQHPVARTHPETGKTTLYVQQGFVRRLAPEHGVPEDEERALLAEMKRQEGRLEFTCRFRWEPGSIAMWDNRAVLHSASADFWPHRRRMERLTILDHDISRRTPYYAPPS